MKKALLFISIIFSIFLLVGCASSNSAGSSNPSDDFGSVGERPDVSMPEYEDSNGSKDEGNVQAGQITASAWNDNENFNYWLDLITHSDNASESSKHYLASSYEGFNSKAPGLEIKNMYTLTITANGTPLNNAKVNVKINNQSLFIGVTNAKGIVYIFIDELYDTNITFDVTHNGVTVSKTLETLPETKNISLNFDEFTSTGTEILDLALVIDTTGSMGDELTYLKAELQNVLENIKQTNLNLTIRLALIFYRDENTSDAYVTRIFDFTTNLEEQYANIKAQNASGGGDTPEAVHSAFTALDNLAWTSGSTKLAIHVCDAPPHSNASVLQSVVSSTKSFAEKGIRFIPVICSGSDEFTEFVFRQTALYTGGTYTYVTDHSGIGNDHSEPATPTDVVVEYLNKMLIRLITEYLTGTDIPPVAYNANDKHTVSFDSNGGTKINIQIVENNGLLTRFENPTKEGCVFCGWVIKGTNKTFTFDTPITSSLTLEAVWLEDDITFEPGINNFYIVTFNTNTDQHYNMQLVSPNGLVNKPEDPVKEGHTFAGWYVYENETLTAYDFSTPVTKSFELTAIFIKNN